MTPPAGSSETAQSPRRPGAETRWLWLGLAMLCSACAPPCPDAFPLCIDTSSDAGCRAWSASCCQGIVACAKGTTFADDAGTCSVVEVPAEKRVICN